MSTHIEIKIQGELEGLNPHPEYIRNLINEQLKKDFDARIEYATVEVRLIDDSSAAVPR